jgi:hypothetical protein
MAGRFSKPGFSRQEEVRINKVNRIRSFPFLGLVLLGLLASGFTGVLPLFVRFVLAVSVLTWIPGAALVTRFFPASARGPLQKLVLWFAAGLALTSLVTWLCILAGLSFGFYSVVLQWGLALVFAAALVHGPNPAGKEESNRYAGGLPGVSVDPGRQWFLILVAVVVTVVAAVYPAKMNLGQDAPDHIGYIRHISTENALEPVGVLALPAAGEDGSVAKAGPDPRKGTVHPVVALAARLADADPAQVWPLFGVFLLPVAFLSFCWFCSAFLPRQELVSVCALLFLMFQGGIGFLYSAEAANGRNIAMQFYWILSPLSLLYVTAPGKKPLILLLIVFLGGAAAHIGTAMHFLVLLATLFVFHRWLGLDRRSVVKLCLWGVGAALAMLAWKFFHTSGAGNLIHTHPNRLMYIGEDWFVVSPFYVLRRHGLMYLGALVMIPFLLFARRSREARYTVAYAVLPCLLCFVPVLTVFVFRFAAYMTFRSLLNVPAFAAVVAAVFLLATWARRRGWPIRIGAAVVLLLWSAVFVIPGLNGYIDELNREVQSRGDPSVFESHADLIDFLRSRPDNSVILSDPKTSYMISAATNHRVVAVGGPHGNPHDPLAMERLAGIRDVLSPFTLLSSAVAACERYGVDFVVVNGRIDTAPTEFLINWEPALSDMTVAKLDQLSTRFRPVFESRNIRVYLYYPGPIPEDRWFPESGVVEFGKGHVHECLIRYPDLGINIVETNVSPKVVLPGETVHVTVGYYKPDVIEYGLPLNLFVRFDHESIYEDTSHYPGEKIVRRWRERRGGYRLRYRADIRPFGNLIMPDQWPIAVKFYGDFRVRLPSSLKPGKYIVSFKLERDAMLPNFALSDLLFNRDHYSGQPCFEIEVTNQVVR